MAFLFLTVSLLVVLNGRKNKMLDSWNNIKNISTAYGRSIQYVEFSDSYNIAMNHGSVTRECTLNKGTEDCNDFEANYKSDGNKPNKNVVLTEPANISLTLYKSPDVETVNAGQEITIDLLLVPEGSETQQILYGGALYTDSPGFEDYVRFQVVDVNNVLGYGAGLVLKEYIKKAYLNNNNTFEDYDDAGAYLPVGLALRCIYKSTKESGETKIKINYLLGVPG